MAESSSFGHDTANEKTKLVDPKDRHSEYGYGGGPKSMYSEDQNDIELRSTYYGDQNGCGTELDTPKDQNGAGQKVIPSEVKNSRTQEAHCMVCRKSEKVKTFDDLRPGDHIEMPIKHTSECCTVKLPIKHHAIVQEIIHKPEQGGATHSGRNRPHKDAHIAQVIVIDVHVGQNQKSKSKSKKTLNVTSHYLGAKNKEKSQDNDKNKGQDNDKDMGKDKGNGNGKDDENDNDKDKGQAIDKGKCDDDKDHDKDNGKNNDKDKDRDGDEFKGKDNDENKGKDNDENKGKDKDGNKGKDKDEIMGKDKDEIMDKDNDNDRDGDENKGKYKDENKGKDKDENKGKDKDEIMGKDNDNDKDQDTEINCKRSKIRKIEYRRRRNTHEQTLENAKKCISTNSDEKYSLFLRNCEHFCVTMVNRDAQIEGGKNIDNASSLQSARSFWVFFHFCIFVFQCVWYGLNFYVYAIYAQGNERYNHFGGNSSSSWMRCCYTKFDYRGVNTICDWIGLGLLLVIYIDAYVCLLYCQRIRGKDVCTQCKISARIVLITKMICFVAMEIVNIFLEKELYAWIEWFDKGMAFTIFIIACLSLLELWLVFFVVPRFLVKLLVEHCLKCCEIRSACCSQLCSACCCYPWDFDEDSYKYVIHYA